MSAPDLSGRALNRARRIVLARRPDGAVRDDDFAWRTSPIPEPGDGEVLLHTRFLSIDPSIRGWLDDRPSYLPPVAIGDVVRSFGLAEVVASRNRDLPVGTVLRGFVGWQDYQVIGDVTSWDVVEGGEFPLQWALGVLGMPGLTAWVGMREIGAPARGETVVVSAATGAVGSLAAQWARMAGARVVGIAGGARKRAILLDELGLDAAVDYRADTWTDDLAAATPDGVDVNFELVGGPVMEAVIGRLNNHARMPLCGLVSGYDRAERPPGPANFGALLTKRVALTGFIAGDHFDRAPVIETQIRALLADHATTVLETVVDGFDEVVAAFVGSFASRHVGKLVVAV